MGFTSIKIGRAKTGAASSGVGDLNAFKNLVRKVEISTVSQHPHLNPLACKFSSKVLLNLW